MALLVLAVLAVTIVGGCNLFTVADCTDTTTYGLNVLVRDSVTLGPPPAHTWVVVTSGVYADSVDAGDEQVDGTLYYLAPGRTGTFDVRVQAPGFQTWRRTGVTVIRNVDQCQAIRTAGVVAYIQR